MRALPHRMLRSVATLALGCACASAPRPADAPRPPPPSAAASAVPAAPGGGGRGATDAPGALATASAATQPTPAPVVIVTLFDPARTTVDDRPLDLASYPFPLNAPLRRTSTETLADEVQRELAPEYAVARVSHTSGGFSLRVTARLAQDDLTDHRIAATEGSVMEPRLESFLRRISRFCSSGQVSWARDVVTYGRTVAARRADAAASLRAHGWSSNYAKVHFSAYRARLPISMAAPDGNEEWNVQCQEEPGAVLTGGIGAAAVKASQPPADWLLERAARNLTVVERVTQHRRRRWMQTRKCSDQPPVDLVPLGLTPHGRAGVRYCTDEDEKLEKLVNPPHCVEPPPCRPGVLTYETHEAAMEQMSPPKTSKRAAKASELAVSFHWTGACTNGTMFLRGVFVFTLARAHSSETKRVDKHTEIMTSFDRQMAPAMFDVITGDRVPGEPIPYNVPDVQCGRGQ